MSEKSIPLIVTVAIIALMFAWVQLLNFACPRWRRALKRRRLKMMNVYRDRRGGRLSVTSCKTIPAKAVSMSTLSSRRLADQSRDILQAISSRGEQAVSRSQSTPQHINSIAE